LPAVGGRDGRDREAGAPSDLPCPLLGREKEQRQGGPTSTSFLPAVGVFFFFFQPGTDYKVLGAKSGPCISKMTHIITKTCP
jgi:hypothetical protein